MTKAEFMQQLSKRLKKLPPSEQASALAYYEEYLAEAGPAAEQEALAALGTPEQVASEIISEYAMRAVGARQPGQAYQEPQPAPDYYRPQPSPNYQQPRPGQSAYQPTQQQSQPYQPNGQPTAYTQPAPAPGRESGGLKTLWIVILAILASPIALPLAFALVVVVLTLLLSIFMVYLSLFIAAVALIVSGIVMIAFSLAAFFTAPIEATLLLGCGLMILAVGAALLLFSIWVSRQTIRFVTWLFARILKRKGAEGRGAVPQAAQTVQATQEPPANTTPNPTYRPQAPQTPQAAQQTSQPPISADVNGI